MHACMEAFPVLSPCSFPLPRPWSVPCRCRYPCPAIRYSYHNHRIHSHCIPKPRFQMQSSVLFSLLYYSGLQCNTHIHFHCGSHISAMFNPHFHFPCVGEHLHITISTSQQSILFSNHKACGSLARILDNSIPIPTLYLHLCNPTFIFISICIVTLIYIML